MMLTSGGVASRHLPVRALAAGALCLAVLGGMLVGHAWPLWTGKRILLAASIVGKGDRHARGEYLRLSTPAMLLVFDPRQAAEGRAYVRQVGGGWENLRREPGGWRGVRGRVVYIQVEPGPNGTFSPVSAGFAPVDGATNVRGRIRTWNEDVRRLHSLPGSIVVDFGLDALYVQEGHAQRIADAIKGPEPLQMEVAVTSSGRARITRLMLNGRPLT